jgi:hypothetical protein
MPWRMIQVGKEASVNVRMRMDPIQNDKNEEYIPEDVKIEHTASTPELDDIIRDVIGRCKGPLGSYPLRGVVFVIQPSLSTPLSIPFYKQPPHSDSVPFPHSSTGWFRENKDALSS